ETVIAAGFDDWKNRELSNSQIPKFRTSRSKFDSSPLAAPSPFSSSVEKADDPDDDDFDLPSFLR
ncbi:MAG: hypothetical protein HKL84_07290, partial [Acidimicrobiaceae bacterium]|nr:hypothetical protein [Acidimicrobiaceae bacterium]